LTPFTPWAATAGGILIGAVGAGVVFGAGLALSDMTNPAKVQNFLDLFGTWDPSLAFVMGAALGVSALGYQLARRRGSPLLASAFLLPTRRDLDPELLAGVVLHRGVYSPLRTRR
jgi:uncharacterized membrane protein YedE/YeeE